MRSEVGRYKITSSVILIAIDGYNFYPNGYMCVRARARVCVCL